MTRQNPPDLATSAKALCDHIRKMMGPASVTPTPDRLKFEALISDVEAAQATPSDDDTLSLEDTNEGTLCLEEVVHMASWHARDMHSFFESAEGLIEALQDGDVINAPEDLKTLLNASCGEGYAPNSEQAFGAVDEWFYRHKNTSPLIVKFATPVRTYSPSGSASLTWRSYTHAWIWGETFGECVKLARAWRDDMVELMRAQSTTIKSA